MTSDVSCPSTHSGSYATVRDSLLALRKPLIGHDITPRLSDIQAPILYVLSATDALFPPRLAEPALRDFAAVGVKADYFEIDSPYGHAAPRVDWKKWHTRLAEFLAA